MIGLDILTEQLERKKKVNVHDAVVQMRKHRMEMVQSMVCHKLHIELPTNKHFYISII